MRFPEANAIHSRALIAYERAQALARNPDYQADIQRLRDEHDLLFGSDGFPADIVVGSSARLVETICERSGLRFPVLPNRLKALTLDEIKNYAAVPIFSDFPGWRKVPRDPSRGEILRWFRTRRPTNPERMFRTLTQSPRRLAARHRGRRAPEVPLQDRYADHWKVYDLRKDGKKESEIIATVWPDEKHTRRDSFENDPLRQRIYDYDRRAKELIGAAYPPIVPTTAENSSS